MKLELFLEFTHGGPLSPTTGSNWIVPGLLLACMKEGEPLEMPEPLSPILLRKLETIQDIYAAWLPGYRHIQITAPLRERPQTGSRTGLLFSCGVDSFYSLLKHQACITDLIVLHGFEFLWNEEQEFKKHLDSVCAVAAEFGKRVIVVRTNVKDLLTRFTRWGYSHGGALACAGLALENEISKCLIASSDSYKDLHPWGSHPMLDPLWSTESLQFLHDGCEATRIQKLQTIADSRVAMKYLRACDNFGKSGNCGQCEKCLRTMVGLHLIGRLKDCPAMPQEIDTNKIRKLRLDESGALFFNQFLQYPVKPWKLKRAIESALRNYRFGLRPIMGRLLRTGYRVHDLAAAGRRRIREKVLHTGWRHHR